MITLGGRARAALASIDHGCPRDVVRADVETLLGDLEACGLADAPIERGDHVMSIGWGHEPIPDAVLTEMFPEAV